MGLGAHRVVDRWRDSPTHLRALDWLRRIGPRAGQLSFLPVIGDPLCAVAGWLPPHFYDRAACGGGAMIDLGAHPMYTLCHFLGEPESARSMFTKVTGKPVEDNAATLLSFKGGAIGLSETGFVSRHNPYTLELSGDKGYLMIQGDRLYLADKESEGKLVEITDLPDALPSPLQRWVGALRMPKPGKVDLHDIGIGPALRLTRVMALAYGNAE